MVDQSDAADAKRMRWLLSGNGYFMEENFLCGHGPCSADEMDQARSMIDEEMASDAPVSKRSGGAFMTETRTVTYAGADWRVVGSYYEGCKGARRDGLQIEPDEPASFEIAEVYLDQNGIDLYEYLTDECLGYLEGAALEQIMGEKDE